MIPVPNAAQLEGIYYYPSPKDAQLFYYLPAAPTPETDLNNKPTATLWLLGETNSLQIGVSLSARTTQIEALRQTLARQQNLSPALIKLSSAPVSVEQVTLTLTENGEPHPIATRSSSGYPPYSTVFQVVLTENQAAQVSAAFGGRQHIAVVTYDLLFSAESQVESRIQGDVSGAISLLSPTATIGDCQQQIVCAIAQNTLALTRTETGVVTNELRSQTDRQVKAQAAQLLMALVQRASFPTDPIATDELTIDAVAQSSEPTRQPVQLITDVGTWFSGRSGLDNIQRSPSAAQSGTEFGTEFGTESGTEPRPQPEPSVPKTDPEEIRQAKVELGFELPVEAIAFVQLSLNGEQGTLQPPEFAPAAFPSVKGEGKKETKEKDLTVKTHYSNGGSPYETTLSAPPDQHWTLAPADLGLHHIQIDGTPLQTAGVQKARIRVQYRPSAGGIADDQTLYFRHDDWQKNWYIVTRSADLAGMITVEYKETRADGSIEHHAEQVFEHADVVLEAR